MIQDKQSGSELTDAVLGSAARLGDQPFQAVSLRVGLRALGPGLLMAGAAVGTSHLVQSTRAGADFGFQLVVLVLLINALKYPFFEYGHRYAAATGENLLDGYLRMGRGFVYGYLNYRLIISTHTPEALQPGCGMRILSWVGLGWGSLCLWAFPFCCIAWRQRSVGRSFHKINRHTI